MLRKTLRLSAAFDEQCLPWAQEGICFGGSPRWLIILKKMILVTPPAPNLPQSMETSYLKNNALAFCKKTSSRGRLGKTL